MSKPGSEVAGFFLQQEINNGIQYIKWFHEKVTVAGLSEDFEAYQAETDLKLRDCSYSLRDFMDQRRAAKDQNEIGYIVEFALAAYLIAQKRYEDNDEHLVYWAMLETRLWVGAITGVSAAIEYKLEDITSEVYLKDSYNRRKRVITALGGRGRAEAKRKLYKVLYQLVESNVLNKKKPEMSYAAENLYEKFAAEAEVRDLLYLLPIDKELQAEFINKEAKHKIIDILDQEKIKRSMARWLSKWEKRDEYFIRGKTAKSHSLT